MRTGEEWREWGWETPTKMWYMPERSVLVLKIEVTISTIIVLYCESL